MRKLSVTLDRCGHECSYFVEDGYLAMPFCNVQGHSEAILDYKTDVGYFPIFCPLEEISGGK